MHKLILGGLGEGKVYFSFLKSVKKVSQSLILSLIANCGLLGSYAPFPTVYITFWWLACEAVFILTYSIYLFILFYFVSFAYYRIKKKKKNDKYCIYWNKE